MVTPTGTVPRGRTRFENRPVERRAAQGEVVEGDGGDWLQPFDSKATAPRGQRPVCDLPVEGLSVATLGPPYRGG